MSETTRVTVNECGFEWSEEMTHAEAKALIMNIAKARTGNESDDEFVAMVRAQIDKHTIRRMEREFTK